MVFGVDTKTKEMKTGIYNWFPNRKVLFLFCLFSTSIWSSNVSGQWHIYNELDCDFIITLSCNKLGKSLFISDTLRGKWGSPSITDISGINCNCTYLDISLESLSTNSILSFKFDDYNRYISIGGDPNDFTNPQNNFIFCCCNGCNTEAPCGIKNGCGTIIINYSVCSIYIQKPSSPFCPNKIDR